MAATSPSRAGKEWPGSTAAGWARWPTARVMFLAYVSPLGRALVDKRLYLPGSWTSDHAAGCRRTGGTTGGVGWRCEAGPGVGLGRRRRPGCRQDWRPWGCATGTTVWTPLDQCIPAFGRPRKPKLRPGQRRTPEQRGDELPDEAWHLFTGGPEKPGAAHLPAMRATRRRQPGDAPRSLPGHNLLAWVGPALKGTEKGDVGLERPAVPERLRRGTLLDATLLLWL